MITTLRSEDLPVADRFAWWREQAAGDTAPTEVSSPHAEDFRATLTLADLGPVRLTIHSFPELRAVRTPALIRRSDSERYGLSLTTANAFWLDQQDHNSRLDVGDLALHDTSKPYDSRALPGAGTGSMVLLSFPRSALPLRPKRLESMLARAVRADTGMSAILARCLTGIASAVRQDEIAEADQERLGAVALDLAAATLAALIDARDQLAPETRQQALVSSIEAFIEYGLGDPDLTPAAIARHHHISLGYLHRLFQSRELTVAAWIRHRRLERCRADLADPRLRSSPVHAVGARWGFRAPAEFSRAFRAEHGMPPGEYRRYALAEGGTTETPRVDPAPTIT